MDKSLEIVNTCSRVLTCVWQHS